VGLLLEKMAWGGGVQRGVILVYLFMEFLSPRILRSITELLRASFNKGALVASCHLYRLPEGCSHHDA
jgi:hypothetical protein